MNEMSPARLPVTLPQETVDRFAAIVGKGHALVDPDQQLPYLKELRDKYVGRSALVLRPGTTDEVSRIMVLANELGLAVVPQSGNTGLVGGQIPQHGEIVISVARLNKVRHVDPAGISMTVEAGLTLQECQDVAEKAGRLFPLALPSQGSCRIGGNLGTNAGGVGVLAYGNTRQQVLGLEVVLADGRVWNGLRALKKDNTGYDLRDLFIGSEGTLGIITEITLRLYGIPESMVSATCAFDTLEGAVDTVIQTIQSGIPVARIELMDTETVDTVNKYSKLALPLKSTLMLEFHGTEAGTKEQAEMVQALAAENGGSNFAWTGQAEERSRMWQARHDAAWAAKSAKPGWGMWATDVCVPISRLAECILETQKDIVASKIYAPIVGHVGDGNFHLTMMVDPDDPTYLPRAEALNDRMVARALALGGTCTGEHGVGIGKIKFLYEEHGEAMSLMRSIKKALDPDNIMNPGKILGPIN